MDEGGLVVGLRQEVHSSFEASPRGGGGVVDDVVALVVAMVGVEVLVAEVAMHFSPFILDHFQS